MDTNRLRTWWLLLVLPFLIRCPLGEEQCPFNDWERITNIDNLFSITPIQDKFKIGDEILVEVTISDSVNIGNNIISLLSETSELTPLILISQKVDNLNLFDNTMALVHGIKDNTKDWFYLEYLFNENKYLLKIVIELQKPGNYSIFAKEARILFGKQRDCNWYEVRTNLKGFENHDFFYEFTVIP